MTHLPPLVTAADLAEYGYGEASDALKRRASTRVRNATQGRQQITPGTSTVKLFGPGPWLLPQRPVTEVTSVTDADGVDVSWNLDGQVLSSLGCAPLTVGFSHGFDPLPDELVELVCAVVDRLGNQSRGVTSGARQEQAGSELVTWSAEALEGASGLTRGELRALRRIYPVRPKSSELLKR